MENNYAYLLVCNEKILRLNNKINSLEMKIELLENIIKQKDSDNKKLIKLIESIYEYQNMINDVYESTKEHQRYMEEYTIKIHN